CDELLFRNAAGNCDDVTDIHSWLPTLFQHHIMFGAASGTGHVSGQNRTGVLRNSPRHTCSRQPPISGLLISADKQSGTWVPAPEYTSGPSWPAEWCASRTPWRGGTAAIRS